jgi:hypothetical protein
MSHPCEVPPRTTLSGAFVYVSHRTSAEPIPLAEFHDSVRPD